jgi:hypothetical protein
MATGQTVTRHYVGDGESSLALVRRVHSLGFGVALAIWF